VVVRTDHGARRQVRVAGVDRAVAVGGDGARRQRVSVVPVRASPEV